MVVLHGRAKVKLLDFNAEVAGTFVGIRDGSIYVELGIEHAHGGRASITGVA